MMFWTEVINSESIFGQEHILLCKALVDATSTSCYMC